SCCSFAATAQIIFLDALFTAGNDVVHIEQNAVRVGILLQNETKRKAVPATYVDDCFVGRKIVDFDCRKDSHDAHGGHGAMEAVELNRIGRKILECELTGYMLHRGLSGFYRVQ